MQRGGVPVLGYFGGNLNDGTANGGLSMMNFNNGLGNANWNTSGGPLELSQKM